jgi:hypothetical protein
MSSRKLKNERTLTKREKKTLTEAKEMKAMERSTMREQLKL